MLTLQISQYPGKLLKMCILSEQQNKLRFSIKYLLLFYVYIYFWQKFDFFNSCFLNAVKACNNYGNKIWQRI